MQIFKPICLVTQLVTIILQLTFNHIIIKCQILDSIIYTLLLNQQGRMQLKTWLLVIRIINMICAGLMIGFEIWYTVQLFNHHPGFLVGIIRIFMPIFVVILAITIITAQFKYSKVVQHFKFLQFIPGLALFNLFIASLLGFQFSTLSDQLATIMTPIFFVVISICLGIMHFLKPAGTESLLATDD